MTTASPKNLVEQLRRILLVPILFIVIGYACYWLILFFFVEAYFPFDPGLGTHFPPGYTEVGFDQIQLGDSQKRVLELIGEPLERGQCIPEFCPFVVWNYSEDKTSPDFAWLYRQVHFNPQGLVIDIVRDIVYD